MKYFYLLLITTFLASNFATAQKESVPSSKKSKKGRSKKGSGDKELDKYFYGGSKKDKNKKGKKEKDNGKSQDKIVDTKAMLKSKGVNTNKVSSGGSVTNKDNGAQYRPVYLGNKIVTGSIESVQGFRINVYNGNARSEAMKQKVAFMKAYPGIRTYLAYSTPNYKINVGDFEDKKLAEKQLKTIKKKFPDAVIIPDVVTAKKIYIYKK